MKRILVILNIFILFNLISIAQENFPTFSQYISNGLTLNPAYSGSRDVVSLNMLYRDQWAGFDGAPVYQYLSANAPLKNAHIGLGLLVENEQTGPQRNTQIYFNYAYRIFIGQGKLSLGLKGGADFSSYNLKNVYINNPGDPAFSGVNESYILPNVGLGMYYYTRRTFIGISVPYLLSYNKTYAQAGSGITNNPNNYIYLFTAGYLIDISRGFKLKPSTLVKYNAQFQQQADLNLNFIFLDNKLSIGAGYRMNNKASGIFEALCGIAEIQFNPQLRLGYAYDYSSGNTYFKYVSHEISLRYEFSYKIKALNPRYF
jgi:type IX secretion system PorP/SprF family membrane protein